ncbi:MAG: hypothetical protein GY940_14155, partial [bacterium]|nr:hypothetical protein [bacterium]
MASKTTLNGEKILLGLLPYWDPMIPPQGISVLKGYLQQHGFPVRTVDANADVRFKNIYTGYFDTLARYIPEELRLNFFHMGHEVLQNHMMAHLHREEEQSADEPDRYSQLVKHLVEKNFFCTAESGLVTELNLLMEEFYSRLEEFLSGLIMEEEPGVVGFSGFCGTLPASMAAFKWIREHYPHIRTVFGGGVFADQLAVGSPDLDYFLEKTTSYIDKIIIGDGEKVFLKYLRGELPESQRVFISADITEPLSLSETPVPDMSDLNAKYYPYLSAAASRSCPFECSFCNVPKFWGRYGVKDIDLTLEQMTRLYKDYGNRLFFLEDFLLNPIITPLAKALMESDLPVYWDGYLRVDRKACDIEKTLLWRRGG